MKVYVLERNVYSDRWIAGVFSTLEAAQAAAPGKWEERTEEAMRNDWPWNNDLDWDEAATIWTFDVQE